jgi:hypothetical protein
MNDEVRIESQDCYADACFIETYTGRKFYPMADEPEFDVEDIAHSLSMICRYNGHGRHFMSVAEHSVLVALVMKELRLGNPWEGLFHDATEAYLSDIPAPFKQLLPDWKKLDVMLESKLRDNFMLPTTKTAGCKEADWLVLFMEAWLLLPDRGECFKDPLNMRQRAINLVEKDGWRPLWLDPKDAKNAWLRMYNDLRS